MKKEKIDYTGVVDIIEDIFGDFKTHNDYKHQISVDCPVCSYEIKGLDDETDGKGNLEINYQYNVYKCWSCSETHGTHGSLYKLIKKFGNNKLLKKYLILRPDDNEDAPKKEFKQAKLPENFISFANATKGIKLTIQYKQAYNYIKSRKITDEMVNKFNIGFCYEGEYQHRIIIPSYDIKGYLNYFIGRSYLNKPKRKYKNPDTQKELILFNESLIDWNKPLYIVEGAFDSIFLDNALPMLGKYMGDDLFNKIYDNAKNKIIIVLDPDAWENAVILYHKMNCGKLMGRVYIVKLEGNKDIAELEGNLSDYKVMQID